MYTLEEYADLDVYFADIEPYLLKQECQNTFFLLMVQRAIKERNEGQHESHYSNAVWNSQHELVFALFLFNNSILYGSYLLDDQFDAIDQSLAKLIEQEKQTQLSWGHAFQPALGHMQKYLTTHTDVKLDIVDEMCCYDIREVQWSTKSSELENDPLTELKTPTENLDFIDAWTNDFLDETIETGNMIRVPTSALAIDVQIKERNIYVLYYDSEPVCMVWKRRPTKNGIAISLVFTPKDKRGQGYASACVSLLTKSLLESYQYVTLFVDARKNIKDNLYTRVGYKHNGDGGRLLVTNVEYKNLKNY